MSKKRDVVQIILFWMDKRLDYIFCLLNPMLVYRWFFSDKTDGHVYTAIFKTDNQQGPTAEHMEICSTLYSSLDWRRVWGRMDICIYIWLNLFSCSSETIITLLIGYTPIQNQRFNTHTHTHTHTHTCYSAWHVLPWVLHS